MATLRSIFWSTLLCSSMAALPQSPVVLDQGWVTNGTVSSVQVDVPNNRIYLGGTFSTVGPNAPFGSKITLASTAPDMAYAKPNGRVRAVVADGSGGWYIAGDFTEVGGVARQKIAHLNPGGVLDALWNPGATATINTIYALCMVGSELIVGGDFTSFGGPLTPDLVRLGSGGAVVTNFPQNTSANGAVRCIAFDGVDGLYVGGDFTDIDGRSGLAKINTLTGLTDSWDPAPNGTVRSIAVSGSTVLVGGSFTSIGAPQELRNNAASFNMSNGALTTWDPNVNATVHAVVSDGTYAYLGGEYTAVNTGIARRKIARFNLATGSLDPTWMPAGGDAGAGSYVYALALNGNALAVAGTISFIGSQSVFNLGLVDVSTGVVSSTWKPYPGHGVDQLAWSGTDLYVAGSHSCIGGERWSCFLALDRTTGLPAPWTSRVFGGTVDVLHLNGNVLYAGGTFIAVGTALSQTPRSKLAALDALTGDLLAWDPNVGGGGLPSVRSICTSGPAVYVGGSFSSMGGQPRNCAAAIDAANGSNVLAWNPNVQGTAPTVLAVETDGSKVFLGGTFSNVGTAAVNNFCAVDPANGTVQFGWAQGANNTVNDLAIDGTLLYVGGNFTAVHGQIRSRLARLKIPYASVDPAWAPAAANTVRCLAVGVQTVFCGGNFAAMNSQSHLYFAALSKLTGAVCDWNLPIDAPTVSSLALDGFNVHVCGSFAKIGSPRLAYALVQDCPALDRYADSDSDGLGNAAAPVFSCAPGPGYVANNTDCNDTNPLVLGPLTYYFDEDEDGHGDPNVTLMSCIPPSSKYTLVHDDCDDTDPAVWLSAPCDDQDPASIGDMIQADCTCLGTIPCTEVSFEIRTDAKGPDTEWELYNPGTNAVVCGGTGLPSSTACIAQTCCITDDPHFLNVRLLNGSNSASSFLLRQGANGRIVHNSNGFAGTEAEYGLFSLPVGDNRLVESSCDANGLQANGFIRAVSDPDVAAQVTATNPQPTHSGYEFWFFDPDGGYSKTVYQNLRAQNGQSGPNNQARYLKLNSALFGADPLPQNVLLNVRVRARVQNVNAPWGPACRILLNAQPVDQYWESHLVDLPGDAYHSCGATVQFDPLSATDHIYATSRSGSLAYHYRFQWTRLSDNHTFLVDRVSGNASNNRYMALSKANDPSWMSNWPTAEADPLPGEVWAVRIATKKAGTSAWSAFGPCCQVTFTGQNLRNIEAQSVGSDGPSISIWPSPNHGDRVSVMLPSDGTIGIARIDWYNAMGALVMQHSILCGDKDVLSQLSFPTVLVPGVYTAVVARNGSLLTGRMVVQ